MPSTNIFGIPSGAYAPNVPCPDAGEQVKSDQLKAVAQALTNQTRWLEDDKASLTLGAVFTGDVDAEVVNVHNLLFVDAPEVAYSSGTFFQRGGRAASRSLVSLSDADHLIDTTQGDEFVLPNAPTVLRTITLRTSTNPVPRPQERLTLVVRNTFTALSAGIMYEIRREDATLIASFQYPTATTRASICAEFVLDGGAWQLSINSGRSYDGVAVLFGVVPN